MTMNVRFSGTEETIWSRSDHGEPGVVEDLAQIDEVVHPALASRVKRSANVPNGSVGTRSTMARPSSSHLRDWRVKEWNSASVERTRRWLQAREDPEEKGMGVGAEGQARRVGEPEDGGNLLRASGITFPKMWSHLSSIISAASSQHAAAPRMTRRAR